MYFVFFTGAVVESKAQLVGIHERVRSDTGSNIPQGQSNGSAVNTAGGKRVATVGNPNAEDAAELLRSFSQLSSTEYHCSILVERIKCAICFQIDQ